MFDYQKFGRNETMEHEIQTITLSKNYNQSAVVDTLSLNIPTGSIYGFLGPNGAGKTTTMRMMVGLIQPDEGEVLYGNRKLKEHKAAILQDVGCFIDAPNYYPHLTGYENLAYIQRILNKPFDEIDRVLHLVDLMRAKDKKVREYSLGMRQRMGLAVALLNDPSILILDEPTNGLDPEGIFEIRHLLMRLSQEENKTILVSSHNLGEIEVMATHIGMINQGKLLYEGSLHDLYEATSNEYTIRVDDILLAKKVLDQRGVVYKDMSSQLRLAITPEEASIINYILVSENIRLYELTQSKKTLEDVFLSLTGSGVGSHGC